MLLVLMLLLIFGGLILGVLAIPALVVLAGLAAAALGTLALIVVPPVVALAGLVGSGIAEAVLAVVTGLGYAGSYASSRVRVLATGRREEPVSVTEQNIPERQLQPTVSTVDQLPYNVAGQCQEQKLIPCPI